MNYRNTTEKLVFVVAYPESTNFVANSISTGRGQGFYVTCILGHPCLHSMSFMNVYVCW